MNLTVNCRECDAEVEVEFTFGEDAQTSGPVEQCHDGSADDCNPEKCPECGAELDQGDIAEKAAQVAEDAELERAIQRDEARRESSYLD
jgi:hypothetical protein